MRVGIVAQRGNERAAALAGEIRETLRPESEVWVDDSTADELDVAGVPVDSMADCDLVVSIGGDGTFLFVARNAGTTPVLGVNLGEVGFLNAVSPADAVAVVATEVERYRDEGEIRHTPLPRIRATGDDWTLEPALNEVVVQGPQRGHGNGVDVEVRVDGSPYTAGHADGVLVSTPTGSTAYNLSEGGPLVHPEVESLVVTEMCASDPMPSLVVGDSEVTVRVSDAPWAVAVGDGRTQREVDVPAEVHVAVDDDPMRVAGPPVDFFDALGKLD